MRDPIDRRFRRRAVAVGCTILLAAGCGAGDDEVDAADTTAASDSTTTTTTADTTTSTEGTTSTTAATALDVCEIITVDDIEAALGVVVPEEGDVMQDPGEDVCIYDSGARDPEVFVQRYDPVGDLLTTTLAGDPTAVELSSVNDEAVLQLQPPAYEGASTAGTITLRRGDVGVRIIVAVSPIANAPTPTEDILVLLAQTAAGKL